MLQSMVPRSSKKRDAPVDGAEKPQETDALVDGAPEKPNETGSSTGKLQETDAAADGAMKPKETLVDQY